jgi:O-antigen/teichoic acid export membrane protein
MLMIAVLVATIVLHFSIECYFILTLLAQFSIVPLSISKIRKDIPFVSFLPKWDMGAFKEMLPYCMNIFSFSLFQFSFYNLRPVFLGMQGNIESVADYRILNGIISIVTLLGGAFTGILLPSTSKIVASDNKEAYDRVAYDGTKYISVLCCFCCFGMMSVAPEVLTLYVGKSYLYLIPWFNLWLICTLCTHNQAISSLILAGDDIRAISYSSIVASVAGLIAAWFLIPYYNIGGVCIAYLIYGMIQMVFYYFYYWPRKMQISSTRVFSYSFFPYCLAGVIVYFAVFHIPSFLGTLPMFFIKGVAFFILFTILTYILFNKNDRAFFAKLIRRK